MCSVFDFIDKQKYFIQSKRKTIQSLYKFLDSIDEPNDGNKQLKTKSKTQSNGVKKQSEVRQQPDQSNGLSNGNHVSQQKIGDKNNLMSRTNGLLGWIDSEKSEQKRKQLAEERRREYNQFIQQKSVDSRNSNSSSKRVTKLIPDYNDILNSKRIEERKHRQTNGLDIDDIEDFTQIETKKSQKAFPEVPIVGWFHCSNNKFDPDYIIPRSRLLATHSSRLRAAKYREELRKQVEEKERIKAVERERIRLEDEEFERKLETQRLKLLREFENEHKLIKQKSHQNSKEEVKQLLKRDLMIGSTSPLSLLRSPTYMHMKENQSFKPESRKSSAVSRSLASVLSETTPTQSMTTQRSDQQKQYPSSDEYSDYDSPVSTDEEQEQQTEEEYDPKSKEAQFRRRVLSELSEVRQMMESDHIKMMEQLRRQQLSQLDE